MFHMLSCFNLRPGESIAIFAAAYADLVAEMTAAGMLESSDPIGRRQADTPMDTDDERGHEYFAVMHFRDRAQVDAAYAHMLRHVEPGEAAHAAVYSRVSDPVFICWEDLPRTSG